MAEALPRTPTRRAAPTLADVLVRQPRAQGLEYLTPYEIDTEAWRLSVLGWSSWRIKAALGLSDIDAVADCLTRYRESDVLSDALKRAIMVAQLDDAIERVIMVMHTDHYKFHKGDVIMMAPDPSKPRELEPVIDDGPVLDASKTLALLLDRKAKLEGLDAPEQHVHTMVPLPPVATDWVARRRAQIVEGSTT